MHNKRLNILIESEMKRLSSILNEERNEYHILEEYGLSEMFSIRSYSYRLFENVSQEDEDYEEFKFILGRLKELVPLMMKRLIQKGFQKAVRFIADESKKAFTGPDKLKAVKKLFFSLLILCAGLSIKFIDTYNEKPVIPQTRIEYISEEDMNTLVVTDMETEEPVMVIEQSNEDEFPEVIEKTEKVVQIAKEIKQKKEEKKTANKQTVQRKQDKKYNSPIVLLSGDVKKTDYYKISDEMIEALMAVEDFSEVIYDAKNPKRKNLDMKNMKQDLTIGYGHKLTKEERKKWNLNKRITREEAKQLFMKDLKETEKYLNKKLSQLPYDKKVEYSQGFVDGMGSLLFNMGYGNMFGSGKREESEFWSRLNKCRIDRQNNCMNVSDINFSIAAVRNQNITQRGHIARRKAEYSIMMQAYGAIDGKLYNLKSNL